MRWADLSGFYLGLDHFTFFFCRGQLTEKCAKIYNARTQLLFSSLNLLFGDVLVPVAVVVCLSSLMTFPDRPCLGVNVVIP